MSSSFIPLKDKETQAQKETTYVHRVYEYKNVDSKTKMGLLSRLMLFAPK